MKKVFYHNKYFNINKLCVLWGKLKKSFIPLQLIGFYIIILKMYKRSYLLDQSKNYILYIYYMICYNIYFISFTDICQTLFLVFYHKFSTTTKNLCYYFNTKCGTPTKHTATHNLRFIWTIFTAITFRVNPALTKNHEALYH